MQGSPLKLLTPDYRGGLPRQKPRGRLMLDLHGPVPRAQVALAINEGAGRWLFDASPYGNHFEVPVATLSSVRWCAGHRGPALSSENAGVNNSHKVARNLNFPSFASGEASRSVSLSFTFTPREENSANAILQWGNVDGDDSSPWIMFRHSNASNQLRVWGAGAYRFDVTNVLYSGNPITIGLKYEHALSRWELFINGVSRGTASTATTGTQIGNYVLLGYGYNWSGLAHFDNLFIQKDAAWSANTFRQLHENPWGAFRPRAAWVPVIAPAGGTTTPVSGDLDLRWDMLAAITQDADLKWQILNALDSDIQLAWSLLNAATNDVQLAWNTLNALTADLDTRWDIRETVNQDVDLRWDIQSALTSVSADLDTRWSVLAGVVSDADLRWQILNALDSDMQLAWSLLNSATGDVQLAWDTLNALTADLDTRWDIRQAIAAALDARWDLLQAVGADADLRWDLANAVVAELDTRWDLLNGVSADADLRWDSLEAAANNITFNWSIDGQAITPITLIRVPAEQRIIPVPREDRIIQVPAYRH